MEVFHNTSSNSLKSNDEVRHHTKPASSPAPPSRQLKPPRPIGIPNKPIQSHITRERNAFDESFAAALHHPPSSHDGTVDDDYDDEVYDDRTPLLNALYDHSNPEPTNRSERNVTPHRIPLVPPQKSKPSLSICLWHEVSQNSQYTRLAAEILHEVLEERYPVRTGSDARTGDHGSAGEATTMLLGNERAGRGRRWWGKISRQNWT